MSLRTGTAVVSTNTYGKDTDMPEQTSNAKLGAAVVGGYLLGRFKKGRQAMRLAAYLNGGQTPPQALMGLGKQGASSVMANDQAKAIVDQLRGPLLEAVQGVILGRLQSSVTGLGDRLDAKTKELSEGGRKAVDTTADTAKSATDEATGLVGKVTGKGKDRDTEAQDASDSQPADDGSGDQAEGQAEGEGADKAAKDG